MRRFTIGRLMGLVVMVAVGFKLHASLGVGSVNLLAAALAGTGAGWVIRTHPEGSRVWRWTAALSLAALAVYLPCLLGPILVGHCSHCVCVWSWLWPVAFGRLALGFLISLVSWPGWPARTELVENTLGAIITAAFILLVAALGLRGRRWRVASLVFASALSLLTVWVFSAMIAS